MKIEEAFKDMEHSFIAGRFAQAYIIAGRPREEGFALAEMIMGLLFCMDDDKPCGHCESCIQVHNGSHPDILRIEPEKKSRVISVKQIRQMQGRMLKTSFAGGWKACVLVGADRLNAPSSNAFLKMLEEPPPRSVFFLLTDSPQFLLPTIVSRCQRVSVATDGESLDSDLRQKVAEVLCRSGGGSPVAAFAAADGFASFLKEIKKAIEDEEEELLSEEARDEGKDKDILDARVLARYKESRMEIMRIVYSWYRDILVLSCGMDGIINAEYKDFLSGKAESLTFAQAMNNVKIVEDINSQLEHNLPEATVMGFGFSKLS